jgi:transposase-like protein
MGKHRTPYAAEFRAHMVELVKGGRTPEELAREFEPTAQTIINWVAQVRIQLDAIRRTRRRDSIEPRPVQVRIVQLQRSKVAILGAHVFGSINTTIDNQRDSRRFS